MSDLAVSRRAVTRALAALPAIAIPAVAGATSRAGKHGEDAMNMHTSIKSARTDSSAWDQAMARLEEAIAASDKFDAEIFLPMFREFERRCGPRPDLSFSYTARDGSTQEMNLLQGMIDRYAEDELWAPYVRPIRDEWRQWKARQERAAADLDFDALNAEHDRLIGVFAELEDELLVMPAPHAAALRWKLEHIIQPGEKGDILLHGDDEVRLAIVADYQRFLPAASI